MAGHLAVSSRVLNGVNFYHCTCLQVLSDVLICYEDVHLGLRTGVQLSSSLFVEVKPGG